MTPGLRPPVSSRQKGDTLDVAVPSQRYVDEIRERFGAQIRGVPERDHPRARPGPLRRRPQRPGRPRHADSPRRSEEIPAAIFNPRYRFETFVVGNSNQLAYAASKSIAENPSGSFNPLFIYGGAGLGKTHLIQAIGHQIRELRPKLKVSYMSAESFMTELIASIRFDKMASFRDRYRSVDALLLDDIQFIAGKERTQEEFFHTFNALYEAQKQIVFTSDRPPKEIPTLEERLRSRFEWGLTADIQPPDLETKVAILRKKAEDKGMHLPQDVALFIAERVRSNVRELEGHLNKIAVFASLAGKTVTIELAKEALKDILSKEDKPINAPEILRVVAAALRPQGLGPQAEEQRQDDRLPAPGGDVSLQGADGPLVSGDRKGLRRQASLDRHVLGPADQEDARRRCAVRAHGRQRSPSSSDDFRNACGKPR